jgi:hypothetical protein
VGEVARIIARRYGNNQRKKAIKNKDLGEELDVVLWFCVSPIKPELIYKLLSIRKWILNRCEIKIVTKQ